VNARTESAVRQGWAWVALTLALAVHVADEALTDFLSVYNPTVEAIRAQYPWVPLPTFTLNVYTTLVYCVKRNRNEKFLP